MYKIFNNAVCIIGWWKSEIKPTGEVRGKSTLIYTGEQAGVSPGINQINDLGMCSNLFQKFQFLRTETLLIYNPIQNLFFVFLSFVS